MLSLTHSFTVQTLPEPLLPAWCCTTQHNGKNKVCVSVCVCPTQGPAHTENTWEEQWCACVCVCVWYVVCVVHGVYVCVCVCVW